MKDREIRPLINVPCPDWEKHAERLLKGTYAPLPETVPDTKDFIYVPSIKLYVAKERSHLRKNWSDSHVALQAENYKMPTIPEFIEFLKHLRSKPKDEEYQRIYNDIVEVRDPWRAEYLDAKFEKQGKLWKINYSHILQNGKLIPQSSEKLEDCLMEDKTPGISLDEWLSAPTSQGLPRKDIADEKLHYWAPHDDAVARFDADSDEADFDCGWAPADFNSSLGVRAVGASAP